MGRNWILTARQGQDDHRGLTSNNVASFSAATTTPSIMGNARRFLNSNPVCVNRINDKVEYGKRQFQNQL